MNKKNVDTTFSKDIEKNVCSMCSIKIFSSEFKDTFGLCQECHDKKVDKDSPYDRK
jgi:hypothetical protein